MKKEKESNIFMGELKKILFSFTAKWAGRFRSGQSGHESKRVIFKRVNRVASQTGRGLSQVASWVELTRIFQTIFFGSRCNLSIVYEFFNCN